MALPPVLLDLARLFVGLTVLSFAAFTDWRWRRAPNVLWAIAVSGGALILAVQAAFDPAPLAARWPYLLALPTLLLLLTDATWADAVAALAAVVGAAAVIVVARASPESMTQAWPYLLTIPIFGAAIYALWYFGLIAGGADAKALLAYSVLLPFPLSLAEGIPLWASRFPASIVLLENSLVLFLAVPLGLAAWNLAHGDSRFPQLFVGVKRRAADVQRGHSWPMETVDAEGKRRMRLFASRMSDSDIEETFARVQALGEERVWVSPKVPFLVPMLGALVVTFLVGDVLTSLIGRFLGPP